jgi:hypothetical protein
MCFWLPLGQTDRNTCRVIRFEFFEILPVLDHFDDELGGEDKTIESQSWGGISKDMKRSYAPDNVSPGSLIPCVAAPKLEKIKITAKLDLGNRKFIMWESFL